MSVQFPSRLHLCLQAFNSHPCTCAAVRKKWDAEIDEFLKSFDREVDIQDTAWLTENVECATNKDGANVCSLPVILYCPWHCGPYTCVTSRALHKRHKICSCAIHTASRTSLNYAGPYVDSFVPVHVLLSLQQRVLLLPVATSMYLYTTPPPDI